ncbi:MAG: tRNA pseudouridine(13) synthase TruD [Gammaproteobacteria bacterium]|nr:MAG: tRNA pseudouridine(13) synthase TruD [Gammaproteobacteria bacterium]
MRNFDFSTLPRVNTSANICSAEIRSLPDYFQVNEVLPFEPDGSGGHVWLNIQKQNINTDWLANELAKFAGVPSVAIGYAGLKDRHAITSQWFSINLEGHQEPDWAKFENDEIQIIKITRHAKKLKRGVLAGNKFKLRLTNVQGEQSLWESSFKHIQQQGVPNYFAEQRFGHQGNNLNRVDYWFSTGKAPRKRNQKSIYLSAARSWLFNLVLAERVQLKNWNQPLAGDVMLLAGTKSSSFVVNDVDDVLQTRLNTMDIHPTGPLWGRGTQLVHSDSLTIEQRVLTDWQDWQQGLEKAGLNQERRSLRLFADDFNWQYIDNSQIELEFFLPAGCYATAVMRELAIITDVHRRNYHDAQVITQDNNNNSE